MTLAETLATQLGEASHHWSAAKDVLKSLGLSEDALHLVTSLLVQLGAALVLRCPLTSIVPWLAVLALELVNEASDLLVERWPDLSHQLAEAGWDVSLTMLLPTVVLLVARLVTAWRARRTLPAE
jgi:hypothetical protein